MNSELSKLATKEHTEGDNDNEESGPLKRAKSAASTGQSSNVRRLKKANFDKKFSMANKKE